MDKETSEEANLENKVVMLVINGKKVEKPSTSSSDQTIPKVPLFGVTPTRSP